MPPLGIPSPHIRAGILPCCRPGEEEVRQDWMEYIVRLQRVRFLGVHGDIEDVSAEVI